MGAMFAWGARHFRPLHGLLAELAVVVAERLLAPVPVPDLHTCQRGPVCATADGGLGCAHASCLAVIMSGGFDDCPGCEEGPWWADCDRHGVTVCERSGSGPGFAGGSVFWADLKCGCTLLDESGDVAAAI